MNTARVRSAATEIDRLQSALSWLTKYGGKVGEDGADIYVRMNFAGSCNGAKEAAGVLQARLANGIPGFIAEAIEDCRNTIEIHRQTIRDEAASTQPGG